MSRGPRIVIPNFPHHVTQRGHDRRAVFAGRDDYRFYLDNLREWSERLGVKVYAYCLMTNHVHSVLDPGDDPETLAALMKRIAGRQTRRVNRLETRIGTLWEGRYRSSPIDSDEYLIACCRYVELNPVRAGMVPEPGKYSWSSYRERAASSRGWLAEDPVYRSLGDSREARARAWRKLVGTSVPEGEWDLIRRSTQRGQPIGSQRFADELSARLKRRVVLRGPGRPRCARPRK